MINFNLNSFTKILTIKFIVTLTVLSLIFSFSKTILYAQAPMTVFGVASSATSVVKILVSDQDCKDAKILVEPSSATGYIFLAYIDEGECSAFEGSKLSFQVNGKLAKETILWRKGGAPNSTTGLVLTTGAQSVSSSVSTSKTSEDATASTKKQSYPALPGPPENEKPKPEVVVKKNSASVVENKNNNEAKKEASVMTKDSKAESAAKVQPNTEKTKQQSTTVSKPMNEEKTIIESSDEGSSNKVIVISGLVTLLVLFSFYALASRR
jgi:hypothetical protein